MQLFIQFPVGTNIFQDIAEYVTGRSYFFIRFLNDTTISIPREDIKEVYRIYEDGKLKQVHLKQFRDKR